MGLPGTHNYVTVFGTWLDTDGNGLSGTVTFEPTVPLTDPTNDFFIRPVVTTVALSSAGVISISLLATDDATIEPKGWGYNVTEVIDGVTTKYVILVAYSNGSVQNLATLH